MADPLQDHAIIALFALFYGNETPFDQIGDHVTRNTLRGLAASAQSELTGNSGSGGQEQTTGSISSSTAREESARLVDWAREHRLLISRFPDRFQPDSPEDRGSMEHHVFIEEDRVIKITKQGAFGIWPVPYYDEWDTRKTSSSPLRYLERIRLCNAVLADDIVLHGVYADRFGNVQIITSQPRYEGFQALDTPITDDELLMANREASESFRLNGFVAVGNDRRTYYRPMDNIAIFDAHLGNLIIAGDNTKELLIPFDVILCRPTGRLRENLILSALKNKTPS